MAKIKPPTSYYGGKYYTCGEIIELFPDHNTYVEPFGGMASVLLNKPASPIEVYNDINSDVTNLFDMIRNRGDELRQMLVLTPYSEEEFHRCGQRSNDKLEQARRTLVRFKMSIGSIGKNFQYGVNRIRRKMPEMVSAWLGSVDDNLPLVIQRLREVQIHNRSFGWIINKYDSVNTLFYCDPPYPSSTRKTTNCYQHEMSDEDHEKFLKQIMTITGKAIISSYDNELYNDYLSSWSRREIVQPNRVKSTGEGRVEILWLNY